MSNKASKKCKKFRSPIVSTELSSENSDSDTPSLETLRSCDLQRKVDQRTVVRTSQVMSNINQKGGEALRFLLSVRSPGPMSPFWAGSADNESLMTSSPSPSGCRASAKIF